MSHHSLCPHVPPSLPRQSIRLRSSLASPDVSAFLSFATESASASLFSESAQRSLLVAARVFVKPPRVALYIEGSDRFVTSTITPITTGWSDRCRVGLYPTERAHVFTAHAKSG